MVNDLRLKILPLLHSGERYFSGEQICRQLNISRVAVWKHIQKLQGLGYKIDASSKGYKLISSPDLLLPIEFPNLKNKLQHFNKIDSTMNAPHENPADFSVIVAEEQTKGRGRMGRTWYSPPGGIYFTAFIKRTLPFSYVQRLNLLACCSVAETIRDSFNLNATIKWPNDILIGAHKVAGMLVEVTGDLDNVKSAGLGIGINVNNAIRGLSKTTSLKNELGKKIDRKKFFRNVILKLTENMAYLEKNELLQCYRKLSGIIGKQIKIKQQDTIIQGKVLDFDSSGAMILKNETGRKIKIFSGGIL